MRGDDGSAGYTVNPIRARNKATGDEAYPEKLTLDAVGEKADLNPRSGTFSTYMSRLRTLELIESGRGWVRASEELFS